MNFPRINITWPKAAEQRASDDNLERAVNQALRDIEGETASRDIWVDEQTSIAISAVWRCVSLISQTAAMLPIHLKQKTPGGRVIVTDHPVCRVFRRPNPLIGKISFMEAIMASTVLWGNGFGHISRRDKLYRPERVDFLLPQRVQVIPTADDIFYRIDGHELIPSRDIFHMKGFTLDGIEGISPIRKHRENLHLTFQAQRFGVNFFKNGCSPSGVFETDKVYDSTAYGRLKSDLSARYMGLSNSSKPLLLEGGLKYNAITIPPEDAQFIATRKFQKTEIATIFGVPPHMIGDLERATNNNIEQQAIEYVQYCLLPYLVKFEEEADNKLLREDEAGTYYTDLGVDGLLRGDSKARAEFYRIMHTVGAMNPNEMRDREDLPRYDGGDTFFVQQNMQPIQNA